MTRPDHLIFLHIQKTAGSTLHDIIGRYYKGREVKTFYNPPMALKFLELPAEERNKIKVLKGHQPYGMHECFSSGSTEYITLLREPADRVISHYYHLKSDKEHPFNEEINREQYTIKQVLESGKILNMNNCMVRLLSGNYNCAYDECSDEMLNKALSNLDSMALVGLHNQFDIFLLRAAERYGWKNPYYRKRRVSKTRIGINEIDAETRSVIEYYNKLDIELFKIMKPKTEAAQQALPELFYKRLEKFVRQNSWAGKLPDLCHKILSQPGL
ncbi:MAG: sulfotransferase family 2 domain-containing protein [Bacteroidia bacterium]